MYAQVNEKLQNIEDLLAQRLLTLLLMVLISREDFTIDSATWQQH